MRYHIFKENIFNKKIEVKTLNILEKRKKSFEKIMILMPKKKKENS